MSNPLARPAHPERVCWGCDRYCPADNLACGRDTVRTPHPIELFGEDWQEFSQSSATEAGASPQADDTRTPRE
jgi:hypothetical protein